MERSNDQQLRQAIVKANRKSLIKSLILTACLGPIGLFYSSVRAGLILLVMSLPITVLTAGAALMIVWPLAVFLGIISVLLFNRRLKKMVRRGFDLTA